MTARKMSSRDRGRVAMAEERAAAKARALATSAGPHRLSELEYQIYQLIERRPWPADLEELRSELRLAGERAEGQEPIGAARVDDPPALRQEVEAVVTALQEASFIETIEDGEAGERLRLTPWGKAAAVSFRHELRMELSDWERRGRRRGERRPERTGILIDISPWDVGPSFDDLEIEYLELPRRIESALEWAGVRTVGQLAGMTVEGLLERKRIGPKSIPVIEARLRAVALELAREEESAGGDVASMATREPRERMDPCWEDKPFLYQVYVCSGGLFDRYPEYKKERVFWQGPLMELAHALDKLGAFGAIGRWEARPLEIAFDTLIVLVDPEWWRKHSPRQFSATDDRRLIELVGRFEPWESEGSTVLRAIEEGPEATWRLLEGVVVAAAETFVRARDPEGLWRCARLMGVLQGEE